MLLSASSQLTTLVSRNMPFTKEPLETLFAHYGWYPSDIPFVEHAMNFPTGARFSNHELYEFTTFLSVSVEPQL